MHSDLPDGFYERDAVSVAQDLLGCRIIRRLADGTELIAAIVETEAYREDDPASHSYRGITDRSRVMFGAPGHAYVYLIYGMYDCFNVVCEPEGHGAAVLVRAVEPLHGWEAMWRLRWPGKEPPEWIAREVRNLTSGPGKLCRALGITREAHDGVWLRETRELAIAPPEGRRWDAPRAAGGRPGSGDTTSAWTRPWQQPWTSRWPLGHNDVALTTRVGITKAAEREWRFYVKDNPFVSRG